MKPGLSGRREDTGQYPTLSHSQDLGALSVELKNFLLWAVP